MKLTPPTASKSAFGTADYIVVPLPDEPGQPVALFRDGSFTPWMPGAAA